MEKISGILPSNSRVTTVDVKSSGQVRGGMPTFGRPVGVTAVAERQVALAEKAKQVAKSSENMLPPTTAETAMNRHKEQMEIRVKPNLPSTQDPQAQIVQDMADRFFLNKAARLAEDEKTEPELIVAKNPTSDMQVDVPSIDEEDMVAVGQYLDVQA